MGMTNRQRQAMETKLRIQEKALELFAREGFENVSMEQIARAAGCTAGNIYNYFASKELLAVKLMDHVDQIYEEMVPVYLEDETRPAKERLLAFFQAALETSCREPLIWQCFVHSLKYPEQKILAIKEERTFFRVLRQLVDGCRQEGSLGALSEAENVVRQLTVIFRGTLVQWRLEEGGFDVREQGGSIAAAYLDQLKKKL